MTTKKIVILGSGESGIGAAILAQQLGYEVLLSDYRAITDNTKRLLKKLGISFEEQHHPSQMINAFLVIKSPGISNEADIIQTIMKAEIPILSEIEFAYQHSKGKIIAVTGSNGKTTTCKLLYHLIKPKLEVVLAGNIGDSYAKAVAKNDVPLYVLEVSSFQLEGTNTFKPHIAVLTNITPDHLERYQYDFEKYATAKYKITQQQDEQDYLVYDADDSVIRRYLKEKPTRATLVPFSLEGKQKYGVYMNNNQFTINMEQTYHITLENLPIQGKHNYKNTMAALAVSQLLRINREEIREGLQSFEGVAHRLEQFLQKDDVRYINDSKATNVNAVFYALESMKRPTIWIVGGIDKGNNYKLLLPQVRQKVKAIICLGIDNTKIIESFADFVPYLVEAKSMKSAVSIAYNISEEGDNVLLSPACSSFDLFDNYEHRGETFKEEVYQITKQP